MSNKGISVVIPNYNGRKLLEQIVPPLLIALDNAELAYEVIISDDASTDDSVFFLQSNYPSFKIICNKSNAGFSPTINKGIFEAQYDYVLLLNSDVKLGVYFFKPMMHYFKHTDTFGVMGRIVGWNDEIIQDAAKYPSFHGTKIKTSGNYYLEDGEDEQGLYSMYLSGANALVSREKLLALGGFNELFAPFYVEDVDLSIRAWRLGWKCYYEHQAICRHQTSTSINNANKKQYIKKIYNRNKLFLHSLHLNGLKRSLWFLQVLVETFFQTLLFKKFYLQSLLMFLQDYKKVIQSRKQLKQLANGKKLLSIDEVVNFITSSIKEKKVTRF